MKLNIVTHQLQTTYFSTNQVQEAVQLYNHMESLQIPTLNTVLVSASSFGTLTRTYPNYFLDTRQFIATLKELL